MTLPRLAAFAAAALSLAGCANNSLKPQAIGPQSGAAAQAEAPNETAPQAQAAPGSTAEAAFAAHRPAPVYDPTRNAAPGARGLDLGAVRAAPTYDAPARPAPTYDPRAAQTPARPGPVHQPAPQAPSLTPMVAQAPARPGPVYEPPRLAPQAQAPVYNPAAPGAFAAAYAPPSPAAPPVYTPAAPQYAFATASLPEAGRAAGGMAPVRDRADGHVSGGSGASSSAGSAAASALPRRSGGRYRTADGDLSAPAPGDLRRTASLGPVGAARSFGFDPGAGSRVVEAARAQTRSPVRYDGSYVKLDYPWGDVPGNIGVCTDVIVRAYRQLGFDFQQMVHEDMREAFAYYPSWEIYGLKEPDPNIDHRRVVNMEAFLERHAQVLSPTRNPQDYQPGDIVSWRISGTQPHMGIVSDKRDERSGTPYIIHNIGAGVKEENMLFLSPPVGHYRFAPSSGSGPIRTAGL